MVDIDERVVQMKFDSSDFEQKSKSTLSILDKLREKLSFKDAMDDNSMNAITDNVEKIANKAYTIVDRMIDKIKDNIANKLVNFLQENTVGQLQSGWKKYADMTTSVATLKGQGYAMEQITEQLERLNYFTDETSYNFTSMVSEIGKFTASGQSLEDATTAMMGIAEWAALSGKNASEASRAMYQLSQALGAGQMRLQDYKSVQNLNMDTIEFRKNAVEAALAVGTLKDNLDGTYTSLINNKITFSLQNFTESLTQGKWFNSEVMMKTYKKYSEAVDEIRDIYEQGSYTDAQRKYTSLNTTADAVKEIKKNNEYLVSKFSETDLGSEEISKLLSKWKKVEKVTRVTEEEYEAMDEAAKSQLKTLQEQQQKNYAEYLKEYAEVFTDAEQSAEDALNEWHSYVSEYGVKAFLSAQEAKTFTDAIESAKDAASTVWTTIYTTVFGNYDEARELWTDLANALYEIFVDRLWDLNDVFEYWKTGGASALETLLDKYEKELARLEENENPTREAEAKMAYLRKEIARIDTELNTIIVNGERTTTYALQEIIDEYQKEAEELASKNGLSAAEKTRLDELRKEIKDLNDQMENSVFANGRTIMLQGVYAFGVGLKSAILNFRDGWDQVTEDNQGGKRLLSFSEKLRIDGLRFYTLMKELGESNFFSNIALGFKQLLAPINGVISVLSAVIGQFLPANKTIKDFLIDLAERFQRFTFKLVPTQETLQKFARILRGLVSIIRLLGKAVLGVWKSILKPIFDQLFDVADGIFSKLLEVVANIADAFYGWENGVDEITAMATVGEILRKTLGSILKVIGTIIKTLLVLFKPVIDFVTNSVKELVGWLNELFSSNGGNVLENVATGFQNIAARARAAWNSVESFESVFNTFKEGTGIGNFLEMIGALIDNIITRIGRTILAILGLEDTVQNNAGVGKALNSIKEALHGIATVVVWLYTNVIRPVLQTLFIGIGAGLKDIGNAFKTGDILHVLEVIKETIKTIGALEIFKLIKAISGILGSGGLLKVFRNGAKALKSISSYFNAKALNERSSAIMKLAISVGLLLGLVAALTFLPAENLENMGKSLLYVGGALVLMIGSLTILSVVAEKSRWGLLGMSAALFGLIGLVVIFLYAAQKVRDLMTELFVVGTKMVDGEEVEITGGEKFLAIASGLTPIILAVTLVLTILLVLRKLGATTALMNFALTMAGIAIGVGMMVIALKMLDDYIRQMDTSHIIGSLLILVVLLAAVSGAIVLATRFMGTGFRFSGGKQALAFALGVAALVGSVAFILVPCLEDLVKQSDKFAEYMTAVFELVIMIFSISGAFALMSHNIKNGFFILMAAAAFAIIASVMKNTLIPAIIEVSNLSLAAVPGVAILGLLFLAISRGIRWMVDGVANIITAISQINAKQFATIILSVGVMVAAIMALSYLFGKNGASINTSFILAAVGTVSLILLAVGIFARFLAKNVIYDEDYANRLYKVFMGITALISAIMLGMMGIVITIRLSYKDSFETGLFILGIFAAVTLATLAGIFLIFTKAIEKLGNIFSDLTIDDIDRLTKVLKMFFISMAVFFGVLMGNTIIVHFTYGNDTLSYLQMMASFVLSASVFLLIVFSTIGKFIQSIITYGITSNELAVISITMLSIMVMFAELGFIVIPAMKDLMGLNWDTVLAAMLGISAVIVSILGMTAVMATASKGGFSEISIVTGLLGLIATLIVMAGLMPAIFKAFESIKDFTNDDIRNGLIAFLVPLGALVLLITIFAASNTGLLFLKTAGEIALGLLAIAAALAAVSAAVALFKEVFGIGEGLKSIGNAMNLGKARGLSENHDVVLNTIDKNNKEEQKEEKKNNGIKSPSKVYKNFGKMIDLGLAQGIKQNRKFVITASKGLAVVTNDTFCDELGIASPSKVFYENGRFVVRGFINGMNDESNKNKQAGADMAAGFSDGIQDALDDAKKGFAGIFDGTDLDKLAEELGKEGGLGFWDSFKNNLLGEEGEVEQLTEEEQKRLEELRNQRDNWIKNWDKDHAAEAGTREYSEARSRALATYSEELNQLERKARGEIKKSSTGLQGSLTDILSGAFGGALDDITSDTSITEKVGGLGAMIGGTLANALGIDQEWFTKFKSNPSDAIGELGSYLTKEGGPLDGVKSKFNEYLGSKNFLDTVTSAGEKAGDAFINGMSKAMGFEGNPIHEFLDFITGNTSKEAAQDRTDKIIETFKENIGTENAEKYSNFFHLLKLSTKDTNIMLQVEDVANMLQEYADIVNNGGQVSRIDLSQSLFDLGTHQLGGWQLISSAYADSSNNLSDYVRYSIKSGVYTEDLLHNIQDYIQSDNIAYIASSAEIIGQLKNMPDDLSVNLGKAFHEMFRNGLFENDLYTKVQELDQNGIGTGKYNVSLTRKGAWLVNKLIGMARNKELGSNFNISNIQSLLGDYDQIPDEFVDGYAEKYEELTGDHFEYTEDQMNDIMKELINLGVIDKETGDAYWAKLNADSSIQEQWANKLNQIRTRGDGSLPVTIVNDETTSKASTIKEMAENAKSLNYLKKLDNAAQHGDTSASKELNKLTSGLGLTNFLSLLDLRHTELQNNIKNASTEDVASGRYKEWQKEMWMYEDYFDIGANNAQGEIDGYSKTVEDNKGNNESNVYMIEQDQKSFDQDSPSKIYYRMGMYNALGLVNGFRDTIDYLTKPTTETIEGLNEASSTAFQAMVNSLDDDSIQPTITPILDDSSFGISTLNRSFEGLTPMMQATVDSFQDDTPNYNSRFEMLANAIYGTNSLVNSFMQMVADGDIITVNVNAEADPNNIYNYVIDANRRKFRQTGKNPLAY